MCVWGFVWSYIVVVQWNPPFLTCDVLHFSKAAVKSVHRLQELSSVTLSLEGRQDQHLADFWQVQRQTRKSLFITEWHLMVEEAKSEPECSFFDSKRNGEIYDPDVSCTNQISSIKLFLDTNHTKLLMKQTRLQWVAMEASNLGSLGRG